MRSIFNKLADADLSWTPKQGLAALDHLALESEKDLIVTLGRFPDVVKKAGVSNEPHQIANYLKKLASDYHAYYNSEKTLVEDEALRNARLTLAEAVRQVIHNGLLLLGVSAPEEM